MASSTRRAVLLRFAQAAADRLHRLADPGGAGISDGPGAFRNRSPAASFANCLGKSSRSSRPTVGLGEEGRRRSTLSLIW